MGDVVLAYGYSLGWGIDHHRLDGQDPVLGVSVGTHLEVKVDLPFHNSQTGGEIWCDPLVYGYMERVEIPLENQTLLVLLGD